MIDKRTIRAIYLRFVNCFEVTKNKWPLEKRVKAALTGFEASHGYKFDINKPMLFTEKIIWYKLFYERADLVRMVDKYLFKDYICEKVGEGYTIPLYGAWTSIQEFRRDWHSLPEEFCLKSTLKSDSQFIKIIHNKSSVNIDMLCHEIQPWYVPKNTLINSYCRAYYSATPRIIAEEFIKEFDQQLYDYKFLCFSGKPEYIYTYENRFSKEKDIPTDDYALTYYDMNWKKIDATIGGHVNGNVPKPIHFDKMVEISRKLAVGLPFVRVDFYEFRNRVYVGELTLYPHGGLLTYKPDSFNKRLGELFVLPNVKVK